MYTVPGQYILTGWPKNLEYDNLGKKKLEKPGILKKTWKFDQKSSKKLEFLTIFTCIVVKFYFDTKNLSHR